MRSNAGPRSVNLSTAGIGNLNLRSCIFLDL